jgi:hypothetical protein
MGVQRRHHAGQRGLDQLLVVDRDDIGLLDDADHVAEQLQHAEGFVAGRLAGGDGGRAAENQSGAADEEQFTHSVSFGRADHERRPWEG